MTAPATGTPVPGDLELLRLPRPPKDYVPAGWRPTHLEVQPSSAEKESRPVRVSVWDAVLTTLEEAKAFRPGDFLVLRGLAGSVRAAGASDVVYENLEAPASRLPGAAGHAGMEGLERRPGEPRLAWCNRLDVVAAAFRLQRPDDG